MSDVYYITREELDEMVNYYDNLPWLVYIDETASDSVTISYPELKDFKVTVTAPTRAEAAHRLNSSLHELFERLIIKGYTIPEPDKIICDVVDLQIKIFKNIKGGVQPII